MANRPKRPRLKASYDVLVDYTNTYCDKHKPKQE